MIELRGIGKQFPGVRALHDVSITVERGEVLGLVGENGAGKSTLIKILGGVYPVGSFRGEVAVAGRVQAFRSTRDARRAGVAIVHQELALVPEMSVADNLVLGREPARGGLVDSATTHALARDMLRGVTSDAIDLDAPAGELGVGVQQLLELARALYDDARVIVLDEPTAALTDTETERLFELVRTRRAGGTSFIYISHRLSEITTICDRVVVLRDGQLVATMPGPVHAGDLVVAMTGEGERLQARGFRQEASEQAPLLAVRGLCVGHPVLSGRRVVDDVSFEVKAGEIVALAGAMGSGRTATLSALFGVAKTRTSGAIEIAGEVVAIRTPIDAIAAGIALVPEDRKGAGLVLEASVGANLALASHDSRLVDDAHHEQRGLAQIKDLVIKTAGLDVPVGTLSGGNQQKVVIGKWLERAPRVLLLDEPTRGVDVGAKAELYALIEGLAERGTAVVLASSDLPEIERLADRVLVLREGHLAGELARPFTQLDIMQLAVGTPPDLAPAEARSLKPEAAPQESP